MRQVICWSVYIGKNPRFTAFLDSNLHTRLAIVTENELGLAFPTRNLPKKFRPDPSTFYLVIVVTNKQTDRQTNAGDYIIPRESFRVDNKVPETFFLLQAHVHLIMLGPRNAMCQSKFCQLLHSSVGTGCTTNLQQIEIMELEGYNHQRLINFVHPATTRSTVKSTSSTVDEFCWPHHRLAMP